MQRSFELVRPALACPTDCLWLAASARGYVAISPTTNINGCLWCRMCEVCVVSRMAQPGVSLLVKEDLAASNAAPIPIPFPQPSTPTVFTHSVYSTSEPAKPFSLQGPSNGSSSTLRGVKSGIASETCRQGVQWTPQHPRLAHRFLPPGITVEELAAQDPKRARRYVASMQVLQDTSWLAPHTTCKCRRVHDSTGQAGYVPAF